MADDVRAARADGKAEKARQKAMRPWFKKKRFIIPLAFVALVIVIAAAGSGEDAERVGTAGDVPRSEGSPTTAAGAAPSSAGSTFKVGEIVRKGSLEAAVLSVDPNVAPTNQFLRPAAGKKIVSVELQVKNTGTKSAQLSSLLQFKLRDSTNAQYDISLLGKEPRFPEGELSPGTTNRGFVSFEVPTAATGLQFAFDANIFGGGRITWELAV
jgi:hypothetical protein